MKPREQSAPDMVGVDLGGTKILAAYVSADGTIAGRAKRPTNSHSGPDAVAARVAQVVSEAIEAAGSSLEKVSAIGVGAPGPLDPETGIILTTPNLGWKNFPLGPRLAEHLGKPVVVDNDVNVGTLGEVRFGAARGARSAVGIFVGTGVGGGIVIDGHIHHGASRNAGEIGHQVIVANGPRCGCGVRGCLEAVASRSAIERALRKKVKEGVRSSLESKLKKARAQLTSRDLRAAYQGGDKLVRKLVNRAAWYAGVGAANMLNLFSPERVVIGGGVAEAFGEPYLERVRESAREHCFAIAYEASRIVLAELGDDAGVLGAAAAARDRLAEAPQRVGASTAR
jgi:glucokinase